MRNLSAIVAELFIFMFLTIHIAYDIKYSIYRVLQLYLNYYLEQDSIEHFHCIGDSQSGGSDFTTVHNTYRRKGCRMYMKYTYTRQFFIWQ